jgi:hypothetical protein
MEKENYAKIQIMHEVFKLGKDGSETISTKQVRTIQISDKNLLNSL